jgi:hypothetical protein
MKPLLSFLPSLAFALACSLPALAQEVVVDPEPLGEPATTVYRQVTPDGRVIYSDKAQRGARVEQTLTVEPPVRGNTWSVEGSARPVAPALAEPTPIKQVASIPPSGRAKTVEEATSDVIRAEMLLEDARKKRDAGHAPLGAEKGNTGPGTAYAARQERLAREVARAEAALERALAERETLRRIR